MRKNLKIVLWCIMCLCIGITMFVILFAGIDLFYKKFYGNNEINHLELLNEEYSAKIEELTKENEDLKSELIDLEYDYTKIENTLLKYQNESIIDNCSNCNSKSRLYSTISGFYIECLECELSTKSHDSINTVVTFWNNLDNEK